MKCVRIDKLVCRSPRLFKVCWMAVAVWMAACVVNVCVPFMSQTVLDFLGGVVLSVAMLMMLLSLELGASPEMRVERIRLVRFHRFVNRKVGVEKAHRIIKNMQKKTKLLILKSYRVLYKNVDFKTFSKWFFIVCALSPLLLLFPDFASCLSTLPLTLALVAFIACLSTLALAFVGILFYFAKMMYWAVVKHSGRVRRVGIDFILMGVVYWLIGFGCWAEWIVNIMVMGCLALFLYDIWQLASLSNPKPLPIPPRRRGR